MFSSKPSLFLGQIVLFLDLSLVFSAVPLFNLCFDQDTYESSSPYRTNLNQLLGLLATNAPSTGFALGSLGQSDARVNGLALCRGDVSSPDCKTCVMEAGEGLPDRCPNRKGAIIWYEDCMLKYSRVDFFGKIDDYNKVYLRNVKDVDNPASFNRKVKELLSGLAEKADDSSRLYAKGELGLGGSKKLYGLVQCSRDLSSVDCKKCIDWAISELSSCCSGKRGGRILAGSCNVRYELYPFFMLSHGV